MEISILFYLGLTVLVGLVFGKLAKLVRLPNVTGYLVGGLIIGPAVLGMIFNQFNWNISLLPNEELEKLGSISEIALGFIAFTIGTNFELSYFKRVGAKPIIIAIFESVGASVLVFVVLVIIGKGQNVPFALLLAAIAAATAPAATIMVVKQYKAKGNTTETLMSVVALDDAVALILFGFAIAIVNAINSASASIAWSICLPFLEVIASLVIGTLAGILLTLLLKWFTGRSNRLACIFGVVLITAALPSMIKFLLPDFEISALLSCMMIGAVFCNFAPKEKIAPTIELVDRFTPPLLIMFFVLSGAGLDLKVLGSVGIIGIIYIVMRVIGKIVGSWFGCTITKCESATKKYLGFALIPQAGVAIGLTIVAGAAVPEYASEIRAVVLCATFIYELIGPVVTKFALTKAGDIEKTNQKLKTLKQ